jgi:tetratricopeptide (TPR) repeat protein
MPLSARICLVLVLLPTTGPLPVHAQEQERRTRFVPLRPQTRQELNRREALKLYAIGLACQRDDRLLEAVRNFEQALRLDPDAVAVHKVLVPLYLALERTGDALQACQKVVALDPGDYETWFIYARQLKAQGQLAQARAALARGVRSKALLEHPDVRQQMYFELGVLCENARDLEQARTAFGQAARILDHPNALLESGPFDRDEIRARAADLYERIGRICVQARKYDEAVAAFRQAQARARDRMGRLSYNLAEVLAAQGKHAAALRCLEDYLRLQPQGTEAYELKIRLLRKLNRQADVIPALLRHVRNDRYNVGLQLLLARQYQVADWPDRAEAIYQELARASATPEVYRGLFNLYKDTPRMGMDRALDLLDRALTEAGNKQKDNAARAEAAARGRTMLIVFRDNPGLVKPLLEAARPRLGRDRLGYETCHFLAVLAARANQLELAEKLYRSCLNGARFDAAINVYSGLLRVLWQAHKYEAVVEVCRQGLRHNGLNNQLFFHLELARALPYVGKFEEAVAAADRAVAEAGEPNRLLARLRRVTVLTLAERCDRAIAECQALLKEYTQPADVHDIRYSLSNAYSAAHDYPKAEAELLRLIKDHPDDATAYNDLGYVWADQGKHLKRAEEFIRKAIALDRQQKKTGPVVQSDQDRDNAAYVDSLGWVLFRRGQLDAARRELEKASSLPDGDDDPVVWDHLGDVYFRLEQPARARAAWRKAVTLYEVERRRKIDQRYKEIKGKLKLLEPEPQP